MANKRIPIPKALATEVMFAADSTCCVCCENGKAVQIHHIDGNPSNNTLENLVVLCLEHHNQTQMSGGFGRKLDASLVTRYRDEWLEDLEWRRAQANERAVTKVVEGVSISQQHNSLIYFWVDASAFVKGYVTEPKGTPEMKYFFAHVPSQRIIYWAGTIGEVISILARRKNRQDITQADFDQIKQGLETKATGRKVYATPQQIDDSWRFIDPHSLNSSDALILQCALDEADNLRAAGDDLVLVCSDDRLVRAAKRERLQTFNPETDSQEDLEIFINTA